MSSQLGILPHHAVDSSLNAYHRFDSSASSGDLVTEIGIGRLIRGKKHQPSRVTLASSEQASDAPLSTLGWDEAVLDMRVGEQATLDITR